MSLAWDDGRTTDICLEACPFTEPHALRVGRIDPRLGDTAPAAHIAGVLICRMPPRVPEARFVGLLPTESAMPENYWRPLIRERIKGAVKELTA